MPTRLDGRVFAVLIVCCASWGLNQVAVKLALPGVAPLWQLGLRSAVATLLVYAWCRWRGIRLFEQDGTLWPGLLAGAFFGVEFALLYVGVSLTTASRAAVLLYLSPFFVAVGAHLLLGERLHTLKVVGLLVAFAGVVLVFSGSGAAAAGSLTGDLLCVLASLCWAGATLTIKRSRLAAAPAEKTLLYQLAVSGLLGLVAAPLAAEPLPDLSAPLVAGSMLYQIAWVSSVTYVLWFGLMRRYPASLLTAATFLTPVFGVLAGITLLGEPLGWRLAVAVVLVLAGIWLVNRPRRELLAA